jgi:glycosyltransferase involved in cell wall biosynthesis
MTDPTYRFTVLTPTRNRGSVLHRVFESLRAQTFRDFEWVVVDNESTDGTADLVAAWQREADFPIRYIVKQNEGVHGSWNRGVAEARGELLLEIRSADTFVPNALERFDTIWREIPDDQRPDFSGVTVNCLDEHGVLIGTEFPSPVLDSDSSEIRFRYKVKGEKWGFQRVDIMREFPMPEVPGYTGYMPEAIVWRAIGRQYKTRYVNERLRVYWQDQTNGISVSRFDSRALGGVLETQSLINEDMRWFRYDPVEFLRKGAKYSRASFLIGRSIREQFQGLHRTSGQLLWLVTLPVGWLFYQRDRRSGAVAT